MKAKFTFLTIALVALLGVGMLMAFKNENKPHKYLFLTVQMEEFVQIDENGKTDITRRDFKSKNVDVLKINEISSAGYRLLQAHYDPSHHKHIYIFEKE